MVTDSATRAGDAEAYWLNNEKKFEIMETQHITAAAVGDVQGSEVLQDIRGSPSVRYCISPAR